MAKKEIQRKGVVPTAPIDGSKNAKVVNHVLVGFPEFNSNPFEENTTHRFVEIDVHQITPRPVNQYKQNRIERLAKSIKNTNNRLIHPIVVVKAKDLPESSEIIQAFRNKGVDINSLNYVIVAGERRFRAWMKLREEEEKSDSYDPLLGNRYDKITANVLTRGEAQNERAYYEDSNLESRQLTPIEAILHIRDALNEVQTEEQKRDAIIEMNGGNTEGIPVDAHEAARKFNQVRYCEYYLAAELGIEGWSPSNLKSMIWVVNNCSDEIVDAILADKITIHDARAITKLDETAQKEIAEIALNEDASAYKAALDIFNKPETVVDKPKRVTHKQVQRALKSKIERALTDRNDISKFIEELGGEDKKNIQKAVALYDDFMKELGEVVDLLK